MAQPARKELDLSDQLKTAGQLVVRARIFFDLWRYFEGAETRPAILDTMNEYSEYFRFDPHAHFVAFIVHTASLFDTRRKDVISLPRLRKICVSSRKVPSKVIDQANTLLAGAQKTVTSVLVLRHNLFAHRSATLSYREAFKKAAVTPNQLLRLTETALRIINCLLIAQGLPEQVFAEMPLADAKKMMAALGRGKMA